MSSDGLPPVKIECRDCLGDGYHLHASGRHASKFPCRPCEGRGYRWVSPFERLPTDELFKGRGR